MNLMPKLGKFVGTLLLKVDFRASKYSTSLNIPKAIDWSPPNEFCHLSHDETLQTYWFRYQRSFNRYDCVCVILRGPAIHRVIINWR